MFEFIKDILKWTKEMPMWIKVSQTPELTKFHALSFTGKLFEFYILNRIISILEPYLEITKRTLNANGDETDNIPDV